ncbi:MAG: AtpZ/AtpI family protein [Candidatus Doudnabacteria bacterium]|nr:AtpZ/AtpI family protein [Candidatus Doudnabacteria bacterium]
MQNSEQKPDQSLSKWRLVNLAFELGFIIALPLVGFGLIGKWLDEKFDTDPWLTLIAILIAIISTTIWLTKRIKELIK